MRSADLHTLPGKEKFEKWLIKQRTMGYEVVPNPNVVA